MKKLLIALLIGAMVGMFSGCSNNTGPAPNKEGVQPYALSLSDKKLLKFLALENKTSIISFKAPKSARSIEVNTYILGEGNTCQKNGGGRISLGKDSNPDEILEGNVAMLLEENYKIEVHVNTDRGSYQLNDNPPVNDNPVRISTRSFLKEFKKIELNKEIFTWLLWFMTATQALEVIVWKVSFRKKILLEWI